MWEYVFLGILQGIFEWIPISSEGILALFSQYLVAEFNPIDIALFTHAGTLIVVVIYFRNDWKEVLMFRNRRLLHFLIIATIISLVIGLPLYKLVRNIAVGTTLLLIVGFALFFTAYFDKFRKKFGVKWNTIAIITGLLQGLAVIPGLSRSGSTIFGLSFSKLSPTEILKTSYMMSAPVVAVSTLYILIENPLLKAGWPALISSFIVGIISLHFLMRVASRIDFSKFAIIFGVLCIIGGIVTLIL
jgi:undecaprenyl-diphosphatase